MPLLTSLLGRSEQLKSWMSRIAPHEFPVDVPGLPESTRIHFFIFSFGHVLGQESIRHAGFFVPWMPPGWRLGARPPVSCAWNAAVRPQ